MRNHLYEELKQILGEDRLSIAYVLKDRQVNQIKTLLDFPAYHNVEEFRILRNYVVLALSPSDIDSPETVLQKMSYMSAITTIIDEQIYSYGGAV